MKLTLIPVEPVRTRKTLAFVNRGPERGGVEEVEVEEYPWGSASFGAAFRLKRQAAGLTLRQGADALGLSATDLSALERGAFTMSQQDWAAAVEAVTEGP